MNRGHTLIEMLAAMVIMIVILAFLLDLADAVERAWRSSSDPFAEAQNAFETMTRHLANATLEPYPDYVDSTGAFRTNSTSPFVPDHLARRSDLDFVCGPAAGTNGLVTSSTVTATGSGVFFVEPAGYTQNWAHTGLENLLNAEGYFVGFGDADNTPAWFPLATHRLRWRLRQVQQPAEALQIYALTSSAAWIQPLVAPGGPTSILADNIITLLVRPERTASDNGPALSPDFRYDSRDPGNLLTHHQLPPRLFLALVAIDEASAQILASQSGTNAPVLVPDDPLQTDLVALDASLTARKIRHRIYQRDISLTAAAWSNANSP